MSVSIFVSHLMLKMFPFTKWTGGELVFLMNLEVKPFKIINDGISKCNWKQIWVHFGCWDV